jgi:hypothetical protein
MENFSVHSKSIGRAPQIFTLKHCVISILIAIMIKNNNHRIISDIENCIKKSFDKRKFYRCSKFIDFSSKIESCEFLFYFLLLFT